MPFCSGGESSSSCTPGPNRVGFVLVHVEHEDWYNSVAGRFGPQVTVNQHHAMRRFTGENGASEAELGQNATKGLRLGVWVLSPVFRAREE